jgi:CHAT domain-containing protein
MVNKLRDTLDVAGYGAKAPRFNAQVSHKLYSELIDPHSFSLKGKNRLIVSASGPLARIPFSVLLETPWTENDYRSAPWLGKRFAVSYAPSPASWMSSLSTTASNKASTLLAWGDPLYKFGGEKISSATSINRSGEIVRSTALKRNAPVRDLTQPLVDVVVYDTLPPLPETREEVKKLAEVLGGNPESDLILGDQATRASVLKASESGELVKRGIVVFATHGLISGDLPNLTQPALAMAGTSGEDESPLLTLDDVLSLKMNADWVVLSACNTAAADGKAQEALSGLARGFFYAGSRSLLVTHWSVESDSAMRLTTETFKAYKENPSLTRAEALQKARLIVMNEKKYSHPAFWAPYVLVGEGGR